MPRRTLTILSLLGLLLGVGLWGVSYFTLHFQSPVRGTLVAGTLHRGSIELYCIGPSRSFYGNRHAELWFEGFEGYTVWMPHVSTAKDYLVLIVPLWIPTLLFAALTWFNFLPVRRRRKRQKLGLCVKCGYDLRGSKERCSECGARFEVPKLNADC